MVITDRSAAVSTIPLSLTDETRFFFFSNPANPWYTYGMENALVNSVTAPFPLITTRGNMRELLFKDNHVLMAGRRA